MQWISPSCLPNSSTSRKIDNRSARVKMHFNDVWMYVDLLFPSL